MRRELRRAVEKDVYYVLVVLGYRKVREDLSQWRRQQFHLIIRKRRKARLVLRLHEDLPWQYPPFHKARHKGKLVSEEMHKILDAYKKRRLANKRD